MTISTRFKGETIDLHTTEYAVPFSNPLAVTAWKREADEMYDCLSTNLPQYATSNDRCFFVSSDTYSRELVTHLCERGIITPTGKVVTYGNFHSRATEYELTA